MTAIDPIPEPTTTQPWNDLFDELKTRYPKVREPILAALAALMQNPDIDAERAKAVAAANGIRITAASIAAAQRLLSRQDAPTEIAPPKDKPAKPAAKARPGRPARRPEANLDVEALIRATAERIQNQGNVEADRLRDGIRKAIGALRAVMSS